MSFTDNTPSARRASLVGALLVILTSMGLFQGAAGAASKSLQAPHVTINPRSLPEDEEALNGGFRSEASGQDISIQWLERAPGSASWVVIPGAHRGSYLVTDPTARSGYQYEARFTNPAGSATSLPATLTDVATTSIWSGYVDTGAQYSSVSATWTVPAVACPLPGPSSNTATNPKSVDGAMEQWVGIGGWDGSPVKQVGVLTQCENGKAYYAPWWQVNSNGAAVASGAPTGSVYAGDVIYGSVNSDGSGQWTFVVNDVTQGWSFSTTSSAASTCSAGGYCATTTSADPWSGAASADFVMEYQAQWDMGPLPDFGTIGFSSVSLVANGVVGGIASSDATEVMLTDQNGYNMTSPQPLQPDSAFTILWKRGN